MTPQFRTLLLWGYRLVRYFVYVCSMFCSMSPAQLLIQTVDSCGTRKDLWKQSPLCFLLSSGPALCEDVHLGSSRQRQHPPGHRRWGHSHSRRCSLWCHSAAGHGVVCVSQWERLPAHNLTVRDEHVSCLLPPVVVSVWLYVKLVLPFSLTWSNSTRWRLSPKTDVHSFIRYHNKGAQWWCLYVPAAPIVVLCGLVSQPLFKPAAVSFILKNQQLWHTSGFSVNCSSTALNPRHVHTTKMYS